MIRLSYSDGSELVVEVELLGTTLAALAAEGLPPQAENRSAIP